MKANTKTKPAFSFGKALLILAALVQGAQYVYAFTAVHHADLPALAIGGGLMAGGVVVGAVAYAGGRLPLIRSKRARVAAWAAFIILLTISPFILTPINWYSMAADLRAAIGGYSWVLAGLVASVPELAIALLAFTDRDLLPAAQPASAAGQAVNSANPAGQAAGRLRKSTAQSGQTANPAGQAAKVYACKFDGCNWTTEKSEAVKRGGDPQAALAAHMSHHNRTVRAAAANIPAEPGQLADVLFKNMKGGD